VHKPGDFDARYRALGKKTGAAGILPLSCAALSKIRNLCAITLEGRATSSNPPRTKAGFASGWMGIMGEIRRGAA